MKQIKWIAAGVAVLFTVSLAACAAPEGGDAIGGDIVAPVTMSVNELQNAEVELVVGQVLNIDTESLAVDTYQGEVSDTKVAKFVQGRADGSATFNPGVEAVSAGTTDVTMLNDQGGIQPLEFTVTVVAR